ncbi:MAG: topoisomerase DNA-binding C4 zinc finger domain-containing protein [Candidatus Berkelbacteria bacterium]
MEAIVILVLFWGGIFLIGWIIESIGRYIEQQKLETREQVFTELLGNSNIKEITEQCKEDIEKLGYDREAEENSKSEFYQSLYRTPYQELLGKCPQCENGYLRMRVGSYGKFIGCSKYPKCQYTTNIQEAKLEHKTLINQRIKEDFRKAYL